MLLTNVDPCGNGVLLPRVEAVLVLVLLGSGGAIATPAAVAGRMVHGEVIVCGVRWYQIGCEYVSLLLVFSCWPRRLLFSGHGSRMSCWWWW